MKPRLLVIFVLMMLIPLALLGWLGVRFARAERSHVEREFQKVLQGRLADLRLGVSRYLTELERECETICARLPEDAGREAWRDLVHDNRWVRQVFLTDAQGRLQFPPDHGDATQAERAFRERTASLWQEGERFYHPPDTHEPPGDVYNKNAPPRLQKLDTRQYAQPQSPQGTSLQREPMLRADTQQQLEPPVQKSQGRTASGWRTWFWGEGINVIYWREREGGGIVGLELSRAVLMADLIGLLPDTRVESDYQADARIVLQDARGELIYEWGGGAAAKEMEPAARISLPAPLGAWSLAYYGGSPVTSVGRTALLGAWMAVLAGVVLTGILAVYFYRESVRDLAEARRRVSFVNQVSHELKTPLTNIRLYAELLEGRLEAGDSRLSRYVATIVAESGRLGRLINNVLTFARHERKRLKLHRAPAVVDEVVELVLSHFRPVFEREEVTVDFRGGAERECLLDSDVLEQILGNLLSNVEKYAMGGGYVGLSTALDGDFTVIRVEDRGPGIGKGEAERVFEPFERLSNRLTEGVSGTGIGLSIVRDLARLHGGDVSVLPSDQGAVFEVRLHTPEATA